MSNEPISFLIHVVSKEFKNNLKNVCVQKGINSTYADICKYLVRSSEGVCQNSIVDHVHLKAPTISLTLKQMEQEGIIERKPDLNDSRKTIVFLTDKGRDFAESFKECLEEVDQEMIKNVSKDDLETTILVLNQIINNLKERR